MMAPNGHQGTITIKNPIMSVLKIDKESLWEAIKEWSRKAGRATTRPALLLWEVLKSGDVSLKEKAIIVACLAYLVLPVDLIPFKRWFLLGLTDEALSLTVVLNKVNRHVTPQIKRRVEDTLDRWFPEYTPYEMIEA